jgi:hypothetical protein
MELASIGGHGMLSTFQLCGDLAVGFKRKDSIKIIRDE